MIIQIEFFIYFRCYYMIWAWIILLRPIWNQGNLQLIPKYILPTQTETTQLFLIPMELWTKHLCGKPMVTSWQIWRFITLLGSYFRSRPVGFKNEIFIPIWPELFNSLIFFKEKLIWNSNLSTYKLQNFKRKFKTTNFKEWTSC